MASDQQESSPGSTIKHDHSESLIVYYTRWFSLPPFTVISRDIVFCTNTSKSLLQAHSLYFVRHNHRDVILNA